MSAIINLFNFTNKLRSKTRKGFSVTISILVHLVALLLIQNIKINDTTLTLHQEEKYVDFGYEEFEEPPEVVEHKVVEETPRELEDITPKQDALPQAQELQDQSSDVSGLQAKTPETPTPVPPVAASTANTTEVPFYKVKPRYPKEALASGMEGNVMMKVDITEDGAVENIRVVGGERVNLFELEARKAVSKWKYKPFTDEAGHTIKKESHLVKVDFRLVDETITN